MIVVLRASVADKPNVQGWLKPDTQYLVLEVTVGGMGGTAYRIESEDNRTPAVFDAELFSLVDNRLSSLWIAEQRDGVPIQLVPATWAEDGFWERFFDGEADARHSYDDVVAQMRNELGLEPRKEQEHKKGNRDGT